MNLLAWVVVNELPRAAKSRQKGSLYKPLERPPDGKDRGVGPLNELLSGPTQTRFSVWHLSNKTSKLEASSHQLIQNSNLQAINLSFSYTVDFTLKLLLNRNWPIRPLSLVAPKGPADFCLIWGVY